MLYSFISHSFLFAAEESGVRRLLEWNFPDETWEWIVYGGGFCLAFLLAISVYLRDTQELSRFWRFWLMSLRMAALAALLVIALNPQERTEQMAEKSSRVAVLIDTSLSMQFPEQTPGLSSAEDDNERIRADAVRDLLQKTNLLAQLQEKHDISIYTFDSKLVGPHAVLSLSNVTQETTPQDKASTETDSSDSSDSSAEQPAAQEIQLADIDWNAITTPGGLETRLGESLLQLMSEVSGETLSGIVLLTDGGANAGVDPSVANEVAKSSRPAVRLIPIGVGSIVPPVNLQIASIQSPSVVHLGDPYELSVFVQSQGLAGRSVQVDLFVKEEQATDAEPILLESQTVTLPNDGLPSEVTFKQSPSSEGELEYYVRVKTQRAVTELSLDDNERRKSVNVIDRKTRVLLVAGGPTREYRFVRNLLHRHNSVSLDVWLQTVTPAEISSVSQESDELLIEFPATAAELAEYDVMIAFDPDWERISDESIDHLVQWVSDLSGGVVLIAGNVYTPDIAELTDSSEKINKIRMLFPVILAPFHISYQFNDVADQPWPVEMTDAGKAAGFLRLSDSETSLEDPWEELSGIFQCYPTDGQKSGATIYANYPKATGGSTEPILIASQFFGAGRVMYFGSSEMWRLRELDEKYYERLWTKVVREVGQGRLQRGSSRGMLLLERDEYVLGQTVRLRARMLTQQMTPLQADSVTFEVYDPKGRPLVPPPQLQNVSNGMFAGNFRASQPGTYRVEIPIPDSSDQLKGKLDVLLPNLESDRPQQNAQLLTELARDTGGRYLRLDEAENELPTLLPVRKQQFLINEKLKTLWDREWVLYLLVGLLSLEWLTRKILKLA